MVTNPAEGTDTATSRARSLLGSRSSDGEPAQPRGGAPWAAAPRPKSVALRGLRPKTDERRAQDLSSAPLHPAARGRNPERTVHLPAKEERSSFLKKRSKRLLQIQVRVPPAKSATAIEKVFWFFSSEKNTSLLPCPTPASAGSAGFHRAPRRCRPPPRTPAPNQTE